MCKQYMQDTPILTKIIIFLFLSLYLPVPLFRSLQYNASLSKSETWECRKAVMAELTE